MITEPKKRDVALVVERQKGRSREVLELQVRVELQGQRDQTPGSYEEIASL